MILINDFTLGLSLKEKIGRGSKNTVLPNSYFKLKQVFLSFARKFIKFLDSVLTLLY